MKHTLIISSVFLAGCGGVATETAFKTPPLPILGLEIGKTYAQPTGGANLVANTVSTNPMTVKINSLSEIEVTRQGETIQMTSESGGILSISSNGRTFLEIGKSLPDGPEMENVLLFFLQDIRLGSFSWNNRHYMVDGLAASSLPTAGAATYSGAITGMSEDNFTFGGDIVLNADFGAGNMSGSLTQNTQTGTVLTFAPTPLVGAGFDGVLTDAADATLTGQINGKIYGVDQSEAAGTFTYSGVDFGAGLFTAKK